MTTVEAASQAIEIALAGDAHLAEVPKFTLRDRFTRWTGEMVGSIPRDEKLAIALCIVASASVGVKTAHKVFTRE